MTPMTDEGRELAALAETIACCRDGARGLGLDVLTYHLDLAVVTARRGTDAAGSPRAPPSHQDPCTGAPEAVPSLDLTAILTTLDGCRSRSRDVGMSLLTYMLDMAVLTAAKALDGSTRTRSPTGHGPCR